MHISNVLLHYRKKIIRGALTNGRDWLFLFIKLNDDYNGASYKESALIQLSIKGVLGSQLQLSSEPDLIAGILAYWVSLMLICRIELLINWMLD